MTRSTHQHAAVPKGSENAVSHEPPRQSPWTVRARIGRVLWGMTQATLWRLSPLRLNGWRRMLLRMFGGTVGSGATIHPSVRVEIPWNLSLSDGVRVERGALLYSLGQIDIGEGSFIGPYAHICAGTHDYSDPRFTLLRTPISIGAGCVLLTDAFIAPGVELCDGVVLLPRAGVFSTITKPGVYRGNPAKRTEEGEA